MTLVLSGNNVGCDTEFILSGTSFICIMKNRAPKIDPWGTPYFITPCQRKKN
jgi:hypothetical protein